MTPKSRPSTRFDSATIIRLILGYEDYWRLMALLFLFGILAAASFYIFARASFLSSSLIRVNYFVDTSRAIQGAGREVNHLTMRSLMDNLTSGYSILEAAKEMGAIDDRTTYADLREALIPKVRISMLDQNLLQLTVEGFKAEVVRDFPAAMVDSYEKGRAKLRSEFRAKAVQRYIDELAVVRKKVIDQLDTRLKFEEESALASAQIELERLSDVPVELVRLRYRIQEMERIKGVLAEQGESLGTTGQLALLTAIEKPSSDRLSTGHLVRNAGVGASPITFDSPESKKMFTQVVVQPDMVDALEPWRELEKKKRALEEKARLMSAKFLEDHPEMRSMREQLREVSSALELELNVARSSFDLEYTRLKDQHADLERKLPEYHQATKTFDEKKLGYDLMQKGQLAWDKAYEQLAKQIESLEFNDDTSAVGLEFRGFVELRDEVPVSPSKSKLALLGCLLGLGLAGGIPFLLRRFDSSVNDLTEFEHSLGIPGIGLVPITDPEILEQVNRAPTIGATVPNALLENFRLIRSSILLNNSPKGPAKVTMITSARPGEGKTTIAANVAWAFSSMGERTLLIDCDLRRGRVHAVTDLINRPGLTDLLTGGATLKETVQKSTADNLWVIPRGPVIPGTTELLNTTLFSEFLRQIREQFDRVVLDTPPVLGLSETAFLQNHAEGVVLVVKSASTPRKDVTEAFQTLQKLGAHFYGFVLNRVDFAKRANMYHYYYYSSNYYDANWHEDQGAARPTAFADLEAK